MLPLFSVTPHKNNLLTMADDSDVCLPQVLTDFVFDLCDSVTQSQIADEQSKLYNVTFRELSSKVRKDIPCISFAKVPLFFVMTVFLFDTL